MKAFVCRCEDVPLAEVEEAIAHGYDDLESLRRYTAVGTGPCQGRSCLAECARLLADRRGVPEETLGLWTMRPPLVPIPLGLLAALPEDTIAALLDRAPHADAPHADETDDKQAWLRRGGRL